MKPDLFCDERPELICDNCFGGNGSIKKFRRKEAEASHPDQLGPQIERSDTLARTCKIILASFSWRRKKFSSKRKKNYSMQRFLSKGWFRACLSSRGWSSATNFVCLCLCFCFCCQSWLTSFLPSRKTTRQTDSFMLMRESKVGRHKKGKQK